MQLDIRLPIGLMFSLLGAILTLSGLLTAPDDKALAPSLGININLWWGIFMFAFGAFMLLLARSAKRKQASPPSNQPVKSDGTVKPLNR